MTTTIKRKGRWERDTRLTGFRLTARDRELVRTVADLGFCTAGQVCDLLFSDGARSNGQRRLTLLHSHRFVDKLVGRSVNEPDVYCLTREAPEGIRLLRQTTAKRDLVRPFSSRPQVEHVLAINDVRCRIARAAGIAGIEFADWRGQAALGHLAERARAVPDAFFVLKRAVEGGAYASAQFLEVERSPRSPRAIGRKYARIREFYESGAYEKAFGYRSLRLLTVTCGTDLVSEQRWARTLSSIAARSGLTFGWFAARRELLDVPADALFQASVWCRPGAPTREALGELNARGPPGV